MTNNSADSRVERGNVLQPFWTQLVGAAVGAVSTFTFMSKVIEPINAKDVQLAQKEVQLAKLTNEIDTKVNERAMRDLTAQLQAEYKRTEAVEQQFNGLASDCKAAPTVAKVLADQAQHAKAQASEISHVITTMAKAARESAGRSCSFVRLNGDSRAALEASTPETVRRLDALCTLHGGTFENGSDTVNCVCK